MSWDQVVITLHEDASHELREVLRVGIGDAIHQELKPLLEQHTRRMLVASLIGEIGQYSSPDVWKHTVKKCVEFADVIMEETQR